jgi:phage gp36-like protein
MSYCSRQDIIDRLSASGVIYVVDDDGDNNTPSPDELAYIDQAIAACDAEIDAALLPYVSIPIDGFNEWLRHRDVDLAVERVIERKGQSVPSSLKEAADRSRRWLELIRKGEMRVPGLAYASDMSGEADSSLGQPRVVNPTAGE